MHVGVMEYTFARFQIARSCVEFIVFIVTMCLIGPGHPGPAPLRGSQLGQSNVSQTNSSAETGFA